MIKKFIKFLNFKAIYVFLLIHILSIPILLFFLLSFYEDFCLRSKKNLEKNFKESLKLEIEKQKEIEVIAKNLYQKLGLIGIYFYDKNGNKVFHKEREVKEKGFEDIFLSIKLDLKDFSKGFDGYGKVEGVYSLNKSMEWMKTSKIKVVTMASIIFGIIFIVIVLFNYFFITHPISLILKGMEKVKEGDLNFYIKTNRKDEIGKLINHFNSLLENLKIAKGEVEKVHKKEMERAEQLASIGEIASGLAHEVKNPLAGISSALEILLLDYPEDSKEREILNQIKKEVERILEILRKLLEYAKPQKPSPQNFDLKILIEDINLLFLPSIKSKEATFNLKIEGNDFDVFLDPNILKQIFLNLLQNSLHAIENYGKIEFLIEDKGDKIRAEITDNGSGIEPKVLEKIFNPFFTTKIGGTGLGLSIVKRNLEEIGGKIKIESKLGYGTKVSLEFPKTIKVA